LPTASLGTTNQVFKYDTKGNVVQTYGKYGGRALRAVPYDPLQFRSVGSLAVSPSGILYIRIYLASLFVYCLKFYAVERYTAPWRIAFLNVNTGEWIRDYYGPVGYVIC
jgi:hypothetical protein